MVGHVSALTPMVLGFLQRKVVGHLIQNLALKFGRLFSSSIFIIDSQPAQGATIIENHAVMHYFCNTATFS